MDHPSVAQVKTRVIDARPSGALIVGIEAEQIHRL
jgi:hypothetical protein